MEQPEFKGGMEALVLPILFSLTSQDGGEPPEGTFSLGEVEQRNGTSKVAAKYSDGIRTEKHINGSICAHRTSPTDSIFSLSTIIN